MLIALLALMGTAMPLSAQAPTTTPQRRHFVEGAVTGEYINTLGPALEQWGGSAEIGVQVWQGEPRNGRTRTRSVRFRVDVMEEVSLLSFLFAPEHMFTRRIGLEVPIGFTALAGSGTSAGVSLGLGIPVVLNDRIAVVPRGTGLLMFEGGVPGLMNVVAVGVRWRF